jgi:hypothetical protein
MPSLKHLKRSLLAIALMGCLLSVCGRTQSNPSTTQEESQAIWLPQPDQDNVCIEPIWAEQPASQLELGQPIKDVRTLMGGNPKVFGDEGSTQYLVWSVDQADGWVVNVTAAFDDSEELEIVSFAYQHGQGPGALRCLWTRQK